MNRNRISQTPVGTYDNRIARRVAAVATLVLMIGTLSPAAHALNADDADSGRTTSSAGEIAGDILLLRPAGLVMSIFGAAFFIPAAILSVAGGWDNVEHAYDFLIREPFTTTFLRPLGGP